MQRRAVAVALMQTYRAKCSRMQAADDRYW